MNRRQFIQSSAALAFAAGAGRALSTEFEEGYATARDGARLYFRVYGNPDGPNLFMGPHFYASRRLDIPGFKDPTEVYIEGLEDRYRLILADYPRGTGKTGHPIGLEFNPDLAVQECELIADAAEADQFAWIGYSYGAALGVQMACRSQRLTALLLGGFPPLNAPFERMLEVTTEMAEDPAIITRMMGDDASIAEDVLWQSVGFYRPLVDWPEREEVLELTIPRMIYMGTNDLAQGLPEKFATDLAGPVRETETELRSLGWEIHWIADAGHIQAATPERALPIVRQFLDRTI